MSSDKNGDGGYNPPQGYILDRRFGEEALDIVKKLVSFGYRYPGSEGHRIAVDYISSLLERYVDDLYRQEFEITLGGKEVGCSNVIGVFRAGGKGKGTLSEEVSSTKSVMIGTHFDTRLIADNEKEEQLRNKPILGANDGGSGTAVQLALVPFLKGFEFPYDVYLVFFDAEDIGNIEGHLFSTGAFYYAKNPIPAMPGEVIVLDMVGGRDMVFDFDAHIVEHMESLALTLRIREIGKSKGFLPFLNFDINKHAKFIICDHYPFLNAGIPTTILIDLNYPYWHTHGDTPDKLSSESLWITGEVVLSYLEALR